MTWSRAAGAQTLAPSVEAGGGPAVTAGALDPETRVLAREFAIRGAEAYDAGDFEAALENFNRATAILDVPSIAVMQARTLVKLGRWLEGLDRFQQTARLDLDATAPLPYREAVAQAREEAEALRAQVPQVALLLGSDTESSGAELSVSFDEKPVPVALLNISRPVNPGSHTVRVSSAGRVFFERTLDVAPSQQIQVHIPPAPSAEAPSPAARRATPVTGMSQTPSHGGAPHDEPRSVNWPLYGALGVAGLGFATAVTTAVLGSNHKATLDAACDSETNTCPPEYEDEISALNTERSLFYLSAGVTALAGGVAAYLWLTEEGDEAGAVALRLSPSTLSFVGHY
ncbi:MAG TPA: hypothetical protein VFQ61_14170 [Polyangiaceae bacterium]|nr:hypothetical protein [Polyangiaceae bacterium]